MSRTQWTVTTLYFLLILWLAVWIVPEPMRDAFLRLVMVNGMVAITFLAAKIWGAF
jgi:hypothetical protein